MAGKQFGESCQPAFGNMLLGLTPWGSNAFFRPGAGAAASLKLSELPMETSFSRTVARSASRARKAVNGRLARRAFARGFCSGPRAMAWRVRPARRAAPGRHADRPRRTESEPASFSYAIRLGRRACTGRRGRGRGPDFENAPARIDQGEAVAGATLCEILSRPADASRKRRTSAGVRPDFVLKSRRPASIIRSWPMHRR